VVLLPVAIGIAVMALLLIVRRQRHERESGLAARRPAYVTVTLTVFALLGASYVAVFVVNTLAR
jgi:putative exporter of polyketide antibiotics